MIQRVHVLRLFCIGGLIASLAIGMRSSLAAPESRGQADGETNETAGEQQRHDLIRRSFSATIRILQVLCVLICREGHGSRSANAGGAEDGCGSSIFAAWPAALLRERVSPSQSHLDDRTRSDRCAVRNARFRGGYGARSIE
jgi:hypothetical protein